MKRIFFILLLAIVSFSAFSQAVEVSDTIYQTETAERYKLFKTQNMWTFLKLDTRNGRVWQVQFSVKGENYRYELPISTVPRVFSLEEFNGRLNYIQPKTSTTS